MTYNLDSFSKANDAPMIKIRILNIEISFHIFFSVNCWETMCDRHQQGDDYRTAFTKAVFQMYRLTAEKSAKVLKEDDFVGLSDKILRSILNEILKQDKKVQSEYHSIQTEDVYERFYQANETIMKNLKLGVSEILERALKKSLVPITGIIEQTTQALRSPFQQLEESIRSSTDSLHSFLLDYRLRSAQNREILLKYGWFLSDEFPIHIVNHIYNNRASLNAGAVDAIICSYFRRNRCEALKNMVSSWKKLPHFACRKIIFHEALVHHSRGYYNSSVTLLTLHMEGIFSDFVRTNLNCSRYRVKQAIKDIQAELEKNPDVSISEEDAFNFIARILTEGFHFDNPDDASDQSRDKIAHGHVYEKESESNSLKLFLSLNEMFHVLPLLSSSNCTSETES